MEIIDALEPDKRGIYSSACSYLSFSGETVVRDYALVSPFWLRLMAWRGAHGVDHEPARFSVAKDCRRDFDGHLSRPAATRACLRAGPDDLP